MVVVISRALLEFEEAALQVDLFPFVLEHLAIYGAFLVFLNTPKSASPSLQSSARMSMYVVAKRQRGDGRQEGGTENRERPERSWACCFQHAAH
jgi:hypothetical protein